MANLKLNSNSIRATFQVQSRLIPRNIRLYSTPAPDTYAFLANPASPAQAAASPRIDSNNAIRDGSVRRERPAFEGGDRKPRFDGGKPRYEAGRPRFEGGSSAPSRSDGGASRYSPRPERDGYQRNSFSPRDSRPNDQMRPRKDVLVNRDFLERPPTPPHLVTLADLSIPQISGLIKSSIAMKHLVKSGGRSNVRRNLQDQTVALMFSKRSTRTRVASESATAMLGGHCMFLGKDDIQLGVNESAQDTAKVVGSMVDGIMARVGSHSEIEELVKYSPVPVINALSDLYHPTQILADLLALIEHYNPKGFLPEFTDNVVPAYSQLKYSLKTEDIFASLKGKKIAWIGDTNNITNDMLVTYPRLGMHMSVASPKGYDKVDERVWAEVEKGGAAENVTLTNSPEEALKDADIVVTDTWISMGQETEKADRLSAFSGYQVTEELCERSGAKKDWIFMHCLPRKQEEVDDDVFYGKRSIVFPEAENRKWTTMACFSHFFGQWKI